MMGRDIWNGGATTGGVYYIRKKDFHRVGHCWMKGRLLEGDLVLCEKHSGDFFFYYWLLTCGFTSVIPDGTYALQRVPASFGAYVLGEGVAILESQTFHLLMADQIIRVPLNLPEDSWQVQRRKNLERVLGI